MARLALAGCRSWCPAGRRGLQAVRAEFEKQGFEALAQPAMYREGGCRRWSTSTVAKWGRIDVRDRECSCEPYYGPLHQIQDEPRQGLPQQRRACLAAADDSAMAERGAAVITVGSVPGPHDWRRHIEAATTIWSVASPPVGASQCARQRHRAGPHKTDFASARRMRSAARRRGEYAAQAGVPRDIGGIAVFLASDAAAATARSRRRRRCHGHLKAWAGFAGRSAPASGPCVRRPTPAIVVRSPTASITRTRSLRAVRRRSR